jgi:hypothetical protein
MQWVQKHLNASFDITRGCYLYTIIVLGKSPGIVSKNIHYLHCVDIFGKKRGNIVCESK